MRTNHLLAITLSLLTTLAASSGARASSEVYGQYFARYTVDLGAKNGDGTPMYPTFANSRGANVPYETFVISHGGGGAGTCWRVSAIAFGGADLQMWVQATPDGAWTSLADDIVNSRDPQAYVFTASSTAKLIRIAEYADQIVKGQFFSTLDSLATSTTEAACNTAAAGKPYLRIDAAGTTTVVRSQGN